MKHTFDADLTKLDGKIKWTVFYVPVSVSAASGTKGRVRVSGTLDGHAFRGTLLPSKNGHYLVFNRQLRDLCKKDVGESLHVEIEQDDEPRVVEVPGEIRRELEACPDALQAFEELPDYMKREEINKIVTAKRQDTRDRRLQKLVQSLLSRDS